MKQGAVNRLIPVRADASPPSEIAIIRPPTRWPTLRLGELWQYRSICFVLTRRSLMVRYRQTAIGAAWSLIQPLSLMLVFTFFFGLLVHVPAQGVPYPVFYLSGLVIWQMVSKILNEGSTSVVANKALVDRVYFPRAYFPISVSLASLVDLAVGLVALASFLVYFAVIPGDPLVIPIAIAIALAASLGLTLALSAINTTYRDITQLMPFLTQVLMFASPIIYSSSIVPESVRWLYFLNPFALAVEGFRHAVANTPAPTISEWLAGTTVTIVLLVGGYLIFRHREPSFADVI